MATDQEVPRVPGSLSLYRKVAGDIKAAIAAGGYAAGTRLPSEHELAERYSVSRGTIRQAFAALRADGIIASRRGARRVVVGGPRVQSFGELLSFSRWARATGEVPGGRVVAMRRREAKPAEAERLALPSGAQVYHLTRVRLLSGHRRGRPTARRPAAFSVRNSVAVNALSRSPARPGPDRAANEQTEVNHADKASAQTGPDQCGNRRGDIN